MRNLFRGDILRNELIKWYYEKTAERLIKNLKKRNINGYFVNSSEEVNSLVKKIIPEECAVGWGGSLTMSACDTISFLKKNGYRCLDRAEAKTTEEREEILRKHFSVDAYFCGINAITMDGEIVQLDGNGNRVAAMIFGPKKVILLAGMNKVVEDLEAALKRIKRISPMNAKRLKLDTPCTETGYCVDCKVKNRICESYGVITDSTKKKDRFHVILIGEELGL